MLVIQVNYLAVLVAALAAWVFGVVWYSAFAQRWMTALGKTKAQLLPRGRPSVRTLAVTFGADVVMAAVLGRLIAENGPVSVAAGLLVAAICWLGFVLTTIVVNNAYTGDRRALLSVESWHWLGVLLVMGVVIGAFH